MCSEKPRVAVSVEFVVPLTVTDQLTPVSSPDSVKVTAYKGFEIAEKLTVRVTLEPLTATNPPSGLVSYPVRVPTAKEYPAELFRRFWKTILVLVDELVVPLNVTDHVDPLGRPDSTNVTEYLAGGRGVNETYWVKSAPFTTTVPEAEEVRYPGTERTEYGHDPLVAVKAIVGPVDETVVPLKSTDHWVPGASPYSEKVTV